MTETKVTTKSIVGRAKDTAIYSATKFLFDRLPVKAAAYALQRPAKSVMGSLLCRQWRHLNNYNTEYPVPELNGRARWVVEVPNRQPTDPVVVYLHGGGYVLGILGGQIDLCAELHKYLKNPRLSIVVLDYSLGPEHNYPTPLVEASKLYYQLTEVDKSTNVILMGDSAGGNLAINICRHIYDPHPDAKKLPSKVAPSGAILISPWVNLTPEKVGTYSTAVNDCLTFNIGTNWGTAYCPDAEARASSWVSQVKAKDVPFSKYLPKNTLLITGEDEGLYDDDIAFAKMASIDNVHVEKNGKHDSVVYELPQVVEGDILANTSFTTTLDFLHRF
uniref:ARAD1A10120p n=1 Tax=Blastobotrys adeninivorans TaxID=409370 RepID=A0A060T2P3_BLAAD